jgi:hypothetical protein
VETADPHPVATAAPFVEGIAQVGEPLVCQPGQWTGTGPVSVAYQWSAAGTAIEGATSPVYVPFAEQAGQSLACVVSASDDVATSTATSAPVTVAALPSPAPAPAEPVPSDGAPQRVVAGIAVDRLVVPGPTARVPVFTSLPGRATLLAIPSHWRPGPAAKSPSRGARAHLAPPTVRVIQQLAAGRGAIALRRLHPNTTYRLVLVFTSAEGQSAQDTATLRVQGR